MWLASTHEGTQTEFWKDDFPPSGKWNADIGHAVDFDLAQPPRIPGICKASQASQTSEI